MLIQIVVGTVTILATMGVMVGFVGATIRFCSDVEGILHSRGKHNNHLYFVLSAAVIMVLAANTVCIWIWAILFRFLEIFPTFEAAVYFSLVSFTTVGYGDVVADEEWRILTSFTAINGLLAFGIFTAFMMEAVSYTHLTLPTICSV